MSISFHGGHSGSYCDHAEGNLDTVICKAIEKQFSHYGLSEHMPRFREADLYPEERNQQRTPEVLEQRFAQYIKDARQLQKHYADSIHLLVGMETEVTHEDFHHISHCCQHYQPDYLVASIHFIDSIPIDYNEAEFERAEAQWGSTESVFCAYYDLQYQLLHYLREQHSELPLVIGHFDLIRLYRPHFELTKAIWERIERNTEYAIAEGCLFEINARAFRKKLSEPYPQATVLQMLHEAGAHFTLGDDSHGPEQVGLHFDQLFDFLKTQPLTTLYALEKPTPQEAPQPRALPFPFQK